MHPKTPQIIQGFPDHPDDLGFQVDDLGFQVFNRDLGARRPPRSTGFPDHPGFQGFQGFQRFSRFSRMIWGKREKGFQVEARAHPKP